MNRTAATSLLGLALGLAACGPGDAPRPTEPPVSTSPLSSSLGLDGRTVRPDCDLMAGWYECRDVRDAPAIVKEG